MSVTPLMHQEVQTMLDRGGKPWATCPFTEAGLVRIVSNPKFTAQSIDVAEALQLLSKLTALTFREAVKPFEERYLGHQHKGVRTTTDQGRIRSFIHVR